MLSVPELEAHFGGKAISVRGSDTSTVSMCSVRVNDMRHEATAQLNAPSPASQALTPQQRLEFFANGGIKLSDTKVFGSIGSCKTSAPLEQPLPSTGCFLSDAKATRP